ncbi:MAG: Chaperone protein DnaK [Chroococcidiopsis sp. SAG 2025]|uniref:Hsp70 family protein n=1 Tax=Chroococcidiopsis sp. SAG 2025 TaxID=171389 RepID=UPI0029371EE9|nr:Hsp70 family protein [Chroococcidiopsis sp. SAG 2025]MDV2998278.1 Chaperone protein DnaK [Chroococcidiopsis sp. SAG 2025]
MNIYQPKGMTDSSQPNFFLLLELDPEKPWSEEDFDQQLKAKQAEWTKKSKLPGNKGKTYRNYLEQIEKIKEVMTNDKERQQQALELTLKFPKEQEPTLANDVSQLLNEVDSITQEETINQTVVKFNSGEQKMSEQSTIFGIDLGTTYSCIAYVDEYGRPTVVANADSDRTTPSVVLFSGGERIVGKEAKASSKLEPDNVVDMVKRFMGKTSEFAFIYDDQNYTPEEISSYILRKLVQDAEQNTGKKITDVVITCPAYFGELERAATKNAGEVAGLNVRAILNEPTAAAISYGINQEEKQTILVYDLGGGTFDITVIKIEGNNIQVICTDGDHNLGGRNWDEEIVSYFAEQWQEQTGSDEDPLESSETLQELFVLAEEAKKALTSKTKKDISFMHGVQRARVSLTREKFDELTEHLLAQTIEKTKLAIAEAKKKDVTKFDKILMVGGSTRMPQVASRIEQELGQEPQFCDPDEAVAKGAAVYGHHLMLGEELVKIVAEKMGVSEKEVDISNVNQDTLKEAQEEVAEIFALPSQVVQKATTTKIVNVTSRSFGVISLNQNRDKIVSNLIFKNDSVPAAKTGKFGTSEANQENVLIEIVDNFSSDAVYNVDGSRKLGDATLNIPTGLPAGAPIEITYELNEQGLLHMYAKELTEGREVTVTLEIEDGISQRELEEIKERSKELVMA